MSQMKKNFTKQLKKVLYVKVKIGAMKKSIG